MLLFEGPLPSLNDDPFRIHRADARQRLQLSQSRSINMDKGAMPCLWFLFQNSLRRLHYRRDFRHILPVYSPAYTLLNDAKGNKDKKDDLLFRRHFPFSSLFPWAVIYFYVLYKIPLFSDNLLQKTPGESFSPGV